MNNNSEQIVGTSPLAQGQKMDFALHTIGWKSFQDLSAHICEVVFDCSVQLYREANDGGQDATFFIPRNSDGPSFNATVQCKHVSTASQRLNYSDFTDEIPKIKKLVSNNEAHRYIFITNMGIDAPVASKIKQKLSELGVIEPFIWGKEKILHEIRASARLRALVPQVYGLGDLSVIIDTRAVEQTKVLLGHWLPKLKTYVSTSSHRASVRALEKHGVVLLLGNPSTGKSTIGAILSTIASEDCNHNVIQLSNPKDFLTHWNPYDRRSFFWFDDAFGANVPRDDFIQDWSIIFPKIQSAISLGNRFLFTSRRHIYRACEKILGIRNLDVFRSSEAIVEVGILNLEEKSQILYNHINFGGQSSQWKSQAKPFLENIVRVENFLPGIAERLGNPAFTKNLRPDSKSMLRFMDEPQEHLIGCIQELNPSMRAALILVFAFQGVLPHAQHAHEAITAVVDATNVSYTEIVEALPALEGSFVRREKREGAYYWTYEHPTISDAVAKILDGQPQMLAALLRGAKIEKVLSDFVCQDAPKIPDAVIVPKELFSILVERIKHTPNELFLNKALFLFLANRADNEVFRKIVIHDPEILARQSYHHGSSWVDPKFETHARAAALGLLPDVCREETVRTLKESALNDFDLSFLESSRLVSLFNRTEIFSLGYKIRSMMEKQIQNDISRIGENSDLTEDAESNFETIKDGLRIISEITGIDSDDDELFLDINSAINSEIDIITERQEELRREEEEQEAANWIYAERSPSGKKVISSQTPIGSNSRSIFDDVDE